MKKLMSAVVASTALLSVWAELPVGFEAVEGISSTAGGNQYIYTDYKPSSCNITIEAKVVMTEWKTECVWCSRGSTTSDMTMTLFGWAKDHYFRMDRNKDASGTYAEKSVELFKPAVLKADYKTCEFFINGEAVETKMKEGDFTPVGKLAFFSSHTNGGGWGNYCVMSILYVRIYDADGNLEREYLPARNTAKAGTKEEYGLYETVSDKKFYPSKASTGFAKYEATAAEFTEETDAEGHELLVLTVKSGSYALTDDDRARIIASPRTLVKRGAGEVVPGSLDGFGGDIVLEDGTWQVSALNSLGTSSVGSVRVKSGATLKHNLNKAPTVTGKKIYLEGNGYGGNGALWVATAAWNSIKDCKFYLTGDTYVNQAARLDYYNSFDTCGYDLRFYGPSSSAVGGSYFTNSTDRVSTVVVDQNQIIVAQGNGNHYRGTSDNRFCMTNGANYSINWKVNHDWTIELQNGAVIRPQMLYPNTNTSNGHFAGPGPIVFSGSVTLGSGAANKSTGPSNETVTISAPMRGSGTINVDPGWFNIQSTDNAYAGTIKVKGRSDVARAGIRVYDGAEYSAEKTVLENADFEYQSGQGLDLGALEVSGARSTLTGPCAFENPVAVSSLTKSGDGSLSLAGNMSVAKADIQAGSILLPKRYYGHAGLMEGTYVDPNVGGQAIWCGSYDNIEEKVGNDNWTYSPAGAVKVLNGYKSAVIDGNKHATAVVYRGYLWNRNPTNETWQFALHMTFRMIMRLNGTWAPWTNKGESGTSVWTTTVKPGANPILIYSLSANWNSDQKPSTTRFDGLGLSYCRNPTDTENPDPTEFVKLEDGGTGFLLTVDDKDVSSSVDMQPQFAEATFGVGTVFDLGGNDFKAGGLTGSPAVTDAGTFTIPGEWNLTEEAVAANAPLAVDGDLAFGGGSVLDLAFDPLLCSNEMSESLASGVVIATADEITGLPGLSPALAKAGATLAKSQDGKALTLTVPAMKSVKIENGQVKVSVSVPAKPITETRVRIVRDGQVIREETIGLGHGRLEMNWSSDEAGLYFVSAERVSETGSEKGIIGQLLLSNPNVAVRYVSTTGSDAKSGESVENAKATVQAAVDALGAAGGTVYVMPGTYTYSTTYNAIAVSNAVAIVGWAADPREVVLQRDGPAGKNTRVLMLNHADASVRMVTLKGGYTWTGGTVAWPDKDTAMSGGANLYINTAGGTAENCIFKDGISQGWSYGGNVYLKAGRVVNCEISGGGMKEHTNDQWRYGGAALIAEAGEIENCWIHGVTASSTGANNAYVVGLYGTAKMIGCTVTDNIGHFCGGVMIADKNVRVYDTAIYDNVATQEGAADTADLYLKTSHSGNNVTDPAAAFVNCAATRAINAACRAVPEPGFVDAANGDYRLMADSSLVNAGSDAAVSGRQSEFDLLGEPRVTRRRVDIGCYEYREPKLEPKGFLLLVR